MGISQNSKKNNGKISIENQVVILKNGNKLK